MNSVPKNGPNAVKLSDLVNSKSTDDIFEEVRSVLNLMVSDFDFASLERVYKDIILLFKGQYPGYTASKTKYHDLEHTTP